MLKASSRCAPSCRCRSTATVARREAFYARVLGGVRALPGVTSAAFVSFLPISSFRGGIWPVSVKGDAEAATDVRSANNVAAIRYVTPGFFRCDGNAARARPRHRVAATRATDQFVAVVSESFVRRYLPDQDPIGRHFTFAYADREIVGVAGDVRFRGLERKSEPQVYLSSQQVADGAITFYAPKALAVRTTGDPARPRIRRARHLIRRADPKLPITEVQTLIDMIDLETASRSVQVRVLAGVRSDRVRAGGDRHPRPAVVRGFAAHAGNRRAARAWRAARRHPVDGPDPTRSLLTIAGVVPGVFLAYAAGRSMEALLAGVPAGGSDDADSAVALAAVMTIAGALAPALRALRVDPMTALRSE